MHNIFRVLPSSSVLFPSRNGFSFSFSFHAYFISDPPTSPVSSLSPFIANLLVFLRSYAQNFFLFPPFLLLFNRYLHGVTINARTWNVATPRKKKDIKARKTRIDYMINVICNKVRTLLAQIKHPSLLTYIRIPFNV